MGGRGSNSQRGHLSIKGVDSCKDMQELRDYMWNNHRVYLAKGLDSVDVDVMKESASHIERLFTEFPALKRLQVGKHQPMIKEINTGITSGLAYACAGPNGAISVNQKRFSSGQKLASTYKSDVKSGFHPNGSDESHIIVHEAGHVMESALIRLSPLYSANAMIAWNKCMAATRVIGEACKLVKKTQAGKTPAGKTLTNNQLISKVSRYAMKNRSEALAECVTDYFANGNNANPLSIQVWNILKRELK